MSDIDCVAYVNDQGAYDYSGQKWSTQSALFIKHSHFSGTNMWEDTLSLRDIYMYELTILCLRLPLPYSIEKQDVLEGIRRYDSLQKSSFCNPSKNRQRYTGYSCSKPYQVIKGGIEQLDKLRKVTQLNLLHLSTSP